MSQTTANEETPWGRWQSVLDQMFEELAAGEPRAEAYWAQQIAFGPVFVHAIALAVRAGAIGEFRLTSLRQVLKLALSMLGPLPDGCDGDPTSLMLLARRQAQVLAWGRRGRLRKLAVRVGLDDVSSLVSEPVPRRFQRPYPLIGWRPPHPKESKTARG